ncbi:hypothetical protein [Devosia sp. CAU 1758]
MGKSLLILPMLLLGLTPVLAAPPTGAQKDEFYRVCVDISQNTELCGCKADAAMTLIDERFMTVVIKAMKGGATEPGQGDAYNSYLFKSNQICKPNY